MARKGTCGKCQTKNVSVTNGLCEGCTRELDLWLDGETGHGRRPGAPSPMKFKLGDMIKEDLAAEGELAGLRMAGGRR